MDYIMADQIVRSEEDKIFAPLWLAKIFLLQYGYIETHYLLKGSYNPEENETTYYINHKAKEMISKASKIANSSALDQDSIERIRDIEKDALEAARLEKSLCPSDSDPTYFSGLKKHSKLTKKTTEKLEAFLNPLQAKHDIIKKASLVIIQIL